MAEAAAVVGIASTLGHGDERQLTRAEAEAFNPGALRTLLQRLRMKPPPTASAGTGEELAAALAVDSGVEQKGPAADRVVRGGNRGAQGRRRHDHAEHHRRQSREMGDRDCGCGCAAS